MLTFAGVMVFCCVVILLRGRRLGTINSVLMLFSALMISAPKAWPMYVLLILPVLCLKMALYDGLRWRIWFAAYSFAMMFHHFAFGSLKGTETWSSMWTVDLVTTICLVAFHVHILIDAVKKPPAALKNTINTR
jgi:hypothetical protein